MPLGGVALGGIGVTADHSKCFSQKCSGTGVLHVWFLNVLGMYWLVTSICFLWFVLLAVSK